MDTTIEQYSDFHLFPSIVKQEIITWEDGIVLIDFPEKGPKRANSGLQVPSVCGKLVWPLGKFYPDV